MSDQPPSEQIRALAESGMGAMMVRGSLLNIAAEAARLEAERDRLRAEWIQVAGIDPEPLMAAYEEGVNATLPERDALRAAVDRVRALHAEQKRRDGYDMSYSSCSADRQDWPCPTIRALDTTEAGDD